MAQHVANIGERRSPEAGAEPKLAPPEVAVARPRPQQQDWALTIVGIAAILAICYFAEEILVVILVSVLLAFILAPIADFLVRLRLPRAVAAGIAVVLLLTLFAVAVYFGINQATALLNELPRYSGEIRAKVLEFVRKTHTLAILGVSQQAAANSSTRAVANWTDLVTRGFGSATQVILAGSFVPFLVFFMLTWQDHARQATVGLFPMELRRDANSTLGMISGMVRSFMIGNLFLALLIGGISMVVFALLGIPFFYFAGILSGFLSLIPYLGAFLSILPPLFLGVGKLTPSEVGWVVLTAFTMHIIAMNFLYPKLLGSRLRLNPLAVTIALLVWAWLWGAVGLALAVPITAGMKIVFDHVPSLRPFSTWLGEETPANGANGNHQPV